LNISFYFTFKAHYENWMGVSLRSYPWQIPTVVDLSEILKQGLFYSVTVLNIISGLMANGISSHSLELFTGDDFAAAIITDGPGPTSPKIYARK
jgi:hypothetical protein